CACVQHRCRACDSRAARKACREPRCPAPKELSLRSIEGSYTGFRQSPDVVELPGEHTMIGGWTMPAYFLRSEPGAAELRRLARRESGRVCQRVLMIANMLEGMEHEEAARLAGLSRSAAYAWHNRYEEDGVEGLHDRPRPGRPRRVDEATAA